MTQLSGIVLALGALVAFLVVHSVHRHAVNAWGRDTPGRSLVGVQAYGIRLRGMSKSSEVSIKSRRQLTISQADDDLRHDAYAVHVIRRRPENPCKRVEHFRISDGSSTPMVVKVDPRKSRMAVQRDGLEVSVHRISPRQEPWDMQKDLDIVDLSHGGVMLLEKAPAGTPTMLFVCGTSRLLTERSCMNFAHTHARRIAIFAYASHTVARSRTGESCTCDSTFPSASHDHAVADLQDAIQRLKPSEVDIISYSIGGLLTLRALLDSTRAELTHVRTHAMASPLLSLKRITRYPREDALLNALFAALSFLDVKTSGSPKMESHTVLHQLVAPTTGAANEWRTTCTPCMTASYVLAAISSLRRLKRLKTKVQIPSALIVSPADKLIDTDAATELATNLHSNLKICVIPTVGHDTLFSTIDDEALKTKAWECVAELWSSSK